MTIIQSEGRLEAHGSSVLGVSSATTQIRWWGGAMQDYAAIYRAQPAVRICVDFFGRHIAQLGLHRFARISDTHRERKGGDYAQLMRRPNPFTPGVKWRWAFASDLALYDEAFNVKVRGSDGRLTLWRVDPRHMDVKGRLRPEVYRFRGRHGAVEIPAEAVVHVYGYNPDDPLRGSSPIEALVSLLAEDQAAAEYRERYWQAAARPDGWIERPSEAPEWGEPARVRFKQEWQAQYGGPEGAGQTPVLEEGMKFHTTTFSARDSQWFEARRLPLEVAASAWHIPAPMVGLLERATFSNITEQHKMLYQDTLPPVCTLIEEHADLLILPELGDHAETDYTEFNLRDKLRGDFEAEAKGLQTMVGRPVMTANEGRARLNLEPVEGGGELVTPLNVLVGGQASPTDVRRDNVSREAMRLKAAGELRRKHTERHTKALRAFFERQSKAVRAAAGAGASTIDKLFDSARWDDELAADLFVAGRQTIEAFGKAVDDGFDVDTTENWLTKHVGVFAANANASTRQQIIRALASSAKGAKAERRTLLDHLEEIFAFALAARAPALATEDVAHLGSFATIDASEGAGRQTKTWITTSSNPRPTHAAVSGETVLIGEVFSNGMRWPGDSMAPADERAGCTCELETV